MIQKRNKIIIFRANNINLIILILLSFLNFTRSAKCDENNYIRTISYNYRKCDNICREDYTGEFFIRDYDYACIEHECPNNRILVLSTKECVKTCLPQYQIGSYCYFEDEMLGKFGLDDYSFDKKVKKCAEYTYKIIDSKKRVEYDCYYDPNEKIHNLTINVKPCPAPKVYDNR